jgi:hypothetical protein
VVSHRPWWTTANKQQRLHNYFVKSGGVKVTAVRAQVLAYNMQPFGLLASKQASQLCSARTPIPRPRFPLTHQPSPSTAPRKSPGSRAAALPPRLQG